MTREEAHQLVDKIYDLAAPGTETAPEPAAETGTQPARVLPEGKRVVRTKSQGDRVFYLDDVKKTRQWVTTPEILDALGFEMGDVVEIEDMELARYQMSAPVYRAPE